MGKNRRSSLPKPERSWSTQAQPKRPTNVQTLIDVARSFYIEGEQKIHIASRLNVDQRKIPQYLAEAKRTGLVRIEIHEPPSKETRQLEAALHDRYKHLKHVSVIQLRSTDRDARFRVFTRRATLEAAKMFDELVDEGKDLHVGMSGGETWLEFANAVPERPRPRVYLYAMTLIGRGSLTMSASHVDAQVTSTVLWSKCGREPGHNRYATVPPYDFACSQLGIGKEILGLSSRKPIEEVIKQMDKINLAFVGIGVVAPPQKDARESARRTMLSVLPPFAPSPQALAKDGAVGEMMGSLFDNDGVSPSKWKFFLSAGHYHPKGGGIEFAKWLVEKRRKVVVIAGVDKEAAVRAALKAKAFNYWFTDAETARAMLNRQ